MNNRSRSSIAAITPSLDRQRFIAFGLVALFLAGCPTTPQEPDPVAPTTAPTAAETGSPTDLDALLEQASIAFDEHRLTTPAEHSAYAIYQEVLRLDPNNDDARRGLEKIVERYVEFALDAVDRRQFGRAQRFLERARTVDADHPAIAPTEEQAQLIENAKRERQAVDASLLKRRSASLALKLQQFGSRAVAANCLVYIHAATDADGRWLYRQINQGSPRSRIRARLQIASPPSVELVCLGA